MMERKQWNAFIFGNFLAFSFLLIINNFWDIGSLVYFPIGVVMIFSFFGMFQAVKQYQKEKKGSDE